MLKPNMVMCYVESLFASTKDKYYAVQLEAISEALKVLGEEKAKLEGKVVADQIKEQLNKAFADVRLNYPQSR